jgi:hypothetical protein
MAIKDPNRVAADRRKVAAQAAAANLSAGRGINCVAADHRVGETCCEVIARATK